MLLINEFANLDVEIAHELECWCNSTHTRVPILTTCDQLCATVLLRRRVDNVGETRIDKRNTIIERQCGPCSGCGPDPSGLLGSRADEKQISA